MSAAQTAAAASPDELAAADESAAAFGSYEDYRGIRYDDWVRLTEVRERAARPRRQAWLSGLHPRPKISIIMPVFRPHLPFLAEAIDSIRKQIYPEWELCVAEDGSRCQATYQLLEQAAAADCRIKVVFRQENGHICRASNDALQMCTGQMTGLFDHDDVLHPDALFWVVRAIDAHRRAKLIFTDEDKLDTNGLRSDPHFKHELDRHILLCQNFVSHFGVYDTAMMRQLGGFRPGFEGSQDHDLALRALRTLADDQVVHVPRVLYHWRRWAGSTASHNTQKAYAQPASLRAVNDFLGHSHQPVKAYLSKIPGCLQVLPTQPPDDLQATLVLRGEPSGPEQMEATAQLLSSASPLCRHIFTQMSAPCIAEISRRLDKTIGQSPFCFHPIPPQLDGRLLGVQGEAGSPGRRALVFVDIGTEAYVSQTWQASPQDLLTHKTWLQDPVARLAAADVAVVGGRILTSEHRVEQLGLAFGPIGLVHHRYQGLHPQDPGYTGRAGIVHEVSAVGVDYMAVDAAVWSRLNGLNPSLNWWVGAIDFCLRAKAGGGKTLVSPYATLRRQQPVANQWAMTRAELYYLFKHHGRTLRRDPRLSPTFVHRSSQLIIAPWQDLERYPSWSKR